jgi:uncharacterized protein (UPF0548 family)
MWQRKLQSWVIRHKSQSKIAKQMQSRLLSKKAVTNSNAGRGSFLTFERPTKERLFEWFGVEGEDPVQVLRCMLSRMQYNHNKVGITNPLLHISGQQEQQEQRCHYSNPGEEERRLLLHTNTNSKCKTALPVSTITSSPSLLKKDESLFNIATSTAMDHCWWPELLVSPNNGLTVGSDSTVQGILAGRRRRQNSPKHKNYRDDWRIIVYRKRVGKGRSCYERVRDAALDWEFEAADRSMGLLEVPSTSSRPLKRKKQRHNQQGVSELYRTSSRYTVQPADIEELGESGTPGSVYRSLGPSSRRLVSYASIALAGFLPDRFRKKLYTINPVMCVYDVVDQRAPGTTFTSTAYATLKGHWLSGEERVSVALRDGSQDVDVEILSVSHAGPSLWGKVVWPFVGKMQSTFFQQHLKHLEDTAAAAPRDVTVDCVPVPVNVPLLKNSLNGLDPSLSTSRKGLFQKQPNKGIPIPSSHSLFDSLSGDDDISLSFKGGTIL